MYFIKSVWLTEKDMRGKISSSQRNFSAVLTRKSTFCRIHIALNQLLVAGKCSFDSCVVGNLFLLQTTHRFPLLYSPFQLFSPLVERNYWVGFWVRKIFAFKWISLKSLSSTFLSLHAFRNCPAIAPRSDMIVSASVLPDLRLLRLTSCRCYSNIM